MVPLRCYIYRRIIQLWEPFKESQLTRSLESWQNLVTKLRQLLLVSFNRHLGKFEDQVRSMREKRTEPRWSFTTYFLLHVGWNAIFWKGFIGFKRPHSIYQYSNMALRLVHVTRTLRKNRRNENDLIIPVGESINKNKGHVQGASQRRKFE